MKCGWEGAEGNYVFFAGRSLARSGQAPVCQGELSSASIGRAGIFATGRCVVWRADCGREKEPDAIQLNLGDAKISSDGAKWAGLARRVDIPEARLVFLLIRGPLVLRTSGGSSCAITLVSWSMLCKSPQCPVSVKSGRGKGKGNTDTQSGGSLGGRGKRARWIVGKRKEREMGGRVCFPGWRCTSTLYKYFSSPVTSDARDFLARGAEAVANSTHEHSPLSVRVQGGKFRPRRPIGQGTPPHPKYCAAVYKASTYRRLLVSNQS